MQRTILSALALGLLSCSPAAPAVPGPGPQKGPQPARVAWFQGGFEEALQQARATNRLVLVDFWTEW
jgi:thiol:disulfide interchange protein